ncbi:MAG: hypothetical protein FWG39_02740 [Alphaproteobacteria bacterium]|nr:hypothetical protein [Alphaproteobacteria bacterium]
MKNSEKPGIGKIVSELRHNHTNYNMLATFYECQPRYRRQLDGVCERLVGGVFTKEQFSAEVCRIEAEVDLTNKKNQKRFIKEWTENAMESGEINKKRAKSRAQASLTKALQFSAYVNKKRKDEKR